MKLKVYRGFFFLPLFLSTLAFKNYSGYQLIRVNPVNAVQLEMLKNLEHKFLTWDNGFNHGSGEGNVNLLEFWRQSNTSSEILVSPTMRKLLLSSLKRVSLEPKVVMHDVGRVIQAQSPGKNFRKSSSYSRHRFDGAVDDPTLFNLHEYHSYEEIREYLEAVEKKHKSFVELSSLGQSFEGRDLVYLKVGYPSDEPKNALFMDAGTHAREWITPAMALYFISKLVGKQEFIPLLENIDIYILPLVNPDGYEYSQNTDRMWRKTRSGPTNGCYGADPNRNYPHFWCTSGASPQACSYQEYCGSKPLSESECRSLAEFLSANNQTIKAYITLHSFGNVLIHPFGHADDVVPEDVDELKRVGRKASLAIRKAGGPLYGVGTTMELIHYTASGASDDYAKDIGIKYVYTMELTNTKYGFLLPREMIRQTAQHVLPAFVVFAEEVWNHKEDVAVPAY
uniref:Peptidase M14 carboxypeptidase A domain-containing protein n=1 Tax=Ditylenchus dipsaci TaxID=166011 RepID=A0A915E046_9BILA